MNDTKKRVALIAGLSVLVVGAGSYFLLAGRSKEPNDAEAVAVVPTTAVPTPAPEIKDKKKRPLPEKAKPKPKIEREPHERSTVPKRTRDRRQPAPERKKELPRAS